MDFSTIKSQFIVLADDPAITSAQAGVWVNTNYRILLREREWPFMVGNGSYTVTSGTAEKAFSAFSSSITDFAKPLRVWIASSSSSNKTLLRPINYEQRNIPGLDLRYYITPNNLSIGLVKTPTNSTDVVTVDYLKTTSDLSADADVPVFVSDFHLILIWKALMMYQFQQREQSDEFRQQYEEILSSMIKFYFHNQAATGARLMGNGLSGVYRTGTTNPLNM